MTVTAAERLAELVAPIVAQMPGAVLEPISTVFGTSSLLIKYPAGTNTAPLQDELREALPTNGFSRGTYEDNGSCLKVLTRTQESMKMRR